MRGIPRLPAEVPRGFLPSNPQTWNGYGWDEIPLSDEAWVSFQSPFSPQYLGEGTVFTRGVAGMPLADESAAHAAWMAANELWPGSGAWGGTSLNTASFGTRPIPMYIVDSTAPGAQFQTMDSCGGISTAEQAVMVGPIPWPDFAVPASNGDKAIAIYDSGTGIMREYFLVVPTGVDGHWTATNGGYSLARADFRDLPSTNYAMQIRGGTSAVVGMHNALGFIGTAEAREGYVRHAVAFTCSNMRQGISWPARAADGLATDPDAPLEGQWCRLPMSVDPDDFNPFTAVVIRAFQEFGGFASDKNLWSHAFNAENSSTEQHWTGDPDPWAAEIPALYGGTLDLSDFPWHLTEWAPADWGRPSPDFGIRLGELAPWIED